jgi:hypothetical protein
MGRKLFTFDPFFIACMQALFSRLHVRNERFHLFVVDFLLTNKDRKVQGLISFN